jgi:hypothetical protein
MVFNATFNNISAILWQSLIFAFSDLRKQARQLENEIDLKLVSFSKLGTNYSSHTDYGK